MIADRRQSDGMLWLVMFLFLFIAPCLMPTAISASESDKVIKTIEIEGLTRMKKDEFVELISLHVGDKFDRNLLGQGIKRLFKKGIFLDVKTVSEDYEEGVRLKYIVRELPVIENIIVNGNSWVSTRDIKRVFLFKEREGLREELLQRANTELISFYHRKGFINVKINITIVDADRGRVNIRIDVDEGNPLIIRRIDIPSEVRRYISFTEGSVLDMDVIERDMKKIEDFYRGKGYLSPVIGPYRFQDGELTIPVDRGTRLEISFDGNRAISTKNLLKRVSIPEYEELTDEQIKDLVDSIRRLYISSGYSWVQVAAGIEREEDVIRLKFFIAEGKRVVLKDVRFKGVSLSSDVLKDIVPLKLEEPYDAMLLEGSKGTLKRFYNALGYLHMEVIDVKEYPDKEGEEIEVEFLINEGPQIRIESISITGNNAIDKFKIKEILNLKEDSPYNAIDIGDARYRLVSLYRRYGYLDIDVEVKSVFVDDKAHLNFIISEGMSSYVGKVIVRGNQKTKDKIIMREIRIREGQPYDYDELMKIKVALFRLGLFDEVSIDLINPLKDDDRVIRDMLVSVKEGKAGTVDIAIGYGDYERLRGSLEVNYRNLGGYNRQIGLRIEASAVQNKYSLNFREPWLLNKPNLPFTLSLEREARRAISLDTKDVLYKVKKLSFIAGTERQIRKNLNAGLNYEYSSVKTTDVDRGVILSREDTGTVAISSISPSLFYDTRDNPFDPRSGSISGVVLKFASKAFLSEAEFVKGIFRSSWYTRLTKNVVFAFSIRGGAAYSFGDTEELPLVERFFLGGRTTVRGYSHDTLGPKGEGNVPTGGNVFALMNAELRIPIKKGFGIVTFIDGGNVWKVIRDIKPDLRYTAGIGLRYRTPVGPVRIDYGHKLDRLPGESPGELHFSIGHAF